MKIPLDDEKTFACIQAADTVGIFQLESEGMKNLILSAMRAKLSLYGLCEQRIQL